jgi:hypothetical protein
MEPVQPPERAKKSPGSAYERRSVVGDLTVLALNRDGWVNLLPGYSSGAPPSRVTKPAIATRICGGTVPRCTWKLAHSTLNAMGWRECSTDRPTSNLPHHWPAADAQAVAQPRVDWATLLRRSFSVDVPECPKCHGKAAHDRRQRQRGVGNVIVTDLTSV